MFTHAMRQTSRVLLSGCAALAVALSASMSVAHAQVVAGVFESDFAGADQLSISAGQAGKTALDTACGTAAGDQVVISGTGLVTAGVQGASVLPLEGANSDYPPALVQISGGACASPAGTIVLDMSGASVNGSTLDCENLTGTDFSSDTILQFSASGVCEANAWHFQITVSSIGIVAAVPGSGSETVVGVMEGLQTGTPCC